MHTSIKETGRGFMACWPFVRVLALGAWLGCLAGVEIYVRPSGDSPGDGTLAKPYIGLALAQQAVRRLIAGGNLPKGGVTVFLRGGLYPLDATWSLDSRDSGTSESPVRYVAYRNEIPRLVGGRTVPIIAFRRLDDDTTKNRIISSIAREKAVVVDLRTLGINDLGALSSQEAVDYGSSTHYVPAPLEVFINGSPGVLARWPNPNPSQPFLSVVDHAVAKVEESKDHQRQVTSVTLGPPTESVKAKDVTMISWEIAKQRMQLWSQADEAYLAGGLKRSYAYASRLITAMDPQRGRFDLIESLNMGEDNRAIGMYWFGNLLEEIDEPGEYYLDRRGGRLIMYPPIDWGASSEVLVSLLSDPIVSLVGCSSVILSGLTIEGGRGNGVYIEGGSGNRLSKCTIRNVGVTGVQFGFGWDAVQGKPLRGNPGAIRQVLCTGAHLPIRPAFSTAMDCQGGCNNGIDDCIITQTGIGGVVLGGGDRGALQAAGNYVTNCDISATDRRVPLYAESVLVHGCGNFVKGCRLRLNLGGHIYILGNDHLIECNDVSSGCLMSGDGGVVEMRQNPSMLGNIIRNNYFHDNLRGNPFGYTIFLDNDTCGSMITGNVFVRNSAPQVKTPQSRTVISINGGHLHTIANNIFTKCNRVWISEGKDYVEMMKVFRDRRMMLQGDVDVTALPYRTRYPEFYTLYMAAAVNQDAKVQLYNRVYNNVVQGSRESIGSSRYQDSNFRHHNWVTEQRLDFVNESSDNYTLKHKSNVRAKVPDFGDIPFDQMSWLLHPKRIPP